MDIYLLICLPDRNVGMHLAVHRIIKCIPTTIANMNAEYEKFTREYMSTNVDYPGYYPMVISRHVDTSFLEQEAKHNAR